MNHRLKFKYMAILYVCFICYVSGIKASDLYTICWQLISELQDWGFKVDYILQDGGEQNREFTKLHFVDAVASKYMTPNVCDMSRNIVISQDYSHVIKKCRNSVLSSGTGKTRMLQLYINDKYVPIVWKYFVDAVQWDRKTNTRLINQKITDCHLYPNNSEKMRNHLAEDMLNKDMLNLMYSYKASLVDGTNLDGCIAFLKRTAILIDIFNDHRPIVSINDERLKALANVEAWFTSWRNNINCNVTNGQKKKMLPSWECLDDLQCLLVTFPEICRIHLADGPCFSIKPHLYNSDIIENHFCQVRGLHNGNKTHPTYYDYTQTVNSIILNESCKSRGRKSNTGIPSADPYKFSMPSKKKKNV